MRRHKISTHVANSCISNDYFLLITFYQGTSFTHLMLITAFLSFFYPKVTGSFVIISFFKNLRWIEHRRTLTNIKTNRWTKKSKNLKNQHCCCQCWAPKYRVSVLSTRCGGYHPKGLIVASSKINY